MLHCDKQEEYKKVGEFEKQKTEGKGYVAVQGKVRERC